MTRLDWTVLAALAAVCVGGGVYLLTSSHGGALLALLGFVVLAFTREPA